jgi:hypothetical protein
MTPTVLRIGLAALVATAFLAAASHRLEHAGPEYDELHQAAGAFAYLGQPTPFFVSARLFGVPALNMTYSGALKTALLGTWLKLGREEFRLLDWRRMGLAIFAAGLLLLGLLAGRALPPALLGLLLLATALDVNFLLTARHDRGPVVLAFLLRAGFLGLWLGTRPGSAPSPMRLGLAGFLVGLAVFEKLSSSVLLVPLLLFATEGGVHRARLLACGCGLLLGALPLVAVNAISLAQRGELISLASLTHENPRDAAALLRVLVETFTVGDGHWARHAMLGVHDPDPDWRSELIPQALLLLVLLWGGRAAGSARARRLALSFLAVPLLLFALPETTVEHHWALAVPFLPAAAVSLFAMPDSTGRARLCRPLALVLVVLVLLLRVPHLVRTLHAIEAGRTAAAFHPEIHEICAFARTLPRDSVVLAADWGIGNQIYCLAQGRSGLVREVFRGYAGAESLHRAALGRNEIYVVALREAGRIAPGLRTRIFADARSLEGWMVVPCTKELEGLQAIEILRLVRAT